MTLHSYRMAFLIVALLLLGGSAAWVWQSDMLAEFEPEQLAQRMEDYGVFAPIVLIGAMVSAVLIAPIPTFPITVTSGYLFGPVWGVVYALIGAMVGAVLSFMIARIGGRTLIAHFMRGHIAFCGQCSDRLLFAVIFLGRLIPVVSFALLSYAAGLTGMRLPAYALATLLGMLPGTMVYVMFGAGLTLSFELMLGVGILFVLMLLMLPLWVERRNLFGLRKYFPHLKRGAD